MSAFSLSHSSSGLDLGGELSLSPSQQAELPCCSEGQHPTSELQGCLDVLSPPRSPEVKDQGDCKDDPCQHEKRQPGLQEPCTAGHRTQTHTKKRRMKKNKRKEWWGREREREIWTLRENRNPSDHHHCRVIIKFLCNFPHRPDSTLLRHTSSVIPRCSP